MIYTTTEKELLAIVFAIEHFRPYLYGYRFILVTDHRPLLLLNNMKDPVSRLARWGIKLSEYNYEIFYKKGTANSNADAVSRNPPNLHEISTNDCNENDTTETIIELDKRVLSIDAQLPSLSPLSTDNNNDIIIEEEDYDNSCCEEYDTEVDELVGSVFARSGQLMNIRWYSTDLHGDEAAASSRVIVTDEIPVARVELSSNGNIAPDGPYNLGSRESKGDVFPVTNPIDEFPQRESTEIPVVRVDPSGSAAPTEIVRGLVLVVENSCIQYSKETLLTLKGHIVNFISADSILTSAVNRGLGDL